MERHHFVVTCKVVGVVCYVNLNSIYIVLLSGCEFSFRSNEEWAEESNSALFCRKTNSCETFPHPPTHTYTHTTQDTC